MPFVPFHAGSTTVTKGKAVKPGALPALPAIPHVPKVVSVAKMAKKEHNLTRTPKPSGAGPRGSNGYFDK